MQEKKINKEKVTRVRGQLQQRTYSVDRLIESPKIIDAVAKVIGLKW